MRRLTRLARRGCTSPTFSKGVRVLNYAGEKLVWDRRAQLRPTGTYDFICNHVGNELWMERLAWSGKKGYNAQELAEWKVNGTVAGTYKTYKNLSVSKDCVWHGGIC
jgi:carboxypeptidase C (cathepsin A)